MIGLYQSNYLPAEPYGFAFHLALRTVASPVDLFVKIEVAPAFYP